MMESKDATLALPLPSQLDKWTSFDVFRYFKSKAIALSILDKELNIFIDERITGKHLIEITIHILRLAGFTIGSSMNIMVEINLLKNEYYISLSNRTNVSESVTDITEIDYLKKILGVVENILEHISL
ncbi:unnamed protein product [Rhizophagus irregularis]|uniref:Uncharacterized protein n=3 Tax=Rhizophagus irregularis TaxID=588596 RepID=A0A916EKK0_9GLOM|nr:hypothetical protein OCT59_015856 [Rhizophagus irregularis]CAB4399696.1 unnamed protein product [Rhizophagus irregularis]CAB4440525.1 unnamed protein product [Rhizophagus irregularis]CAB4492620.1 unnamed protein product [Rhizophagus irregularis]CAB5195563.1 unnamed protein product [Rhizophagus irregularis]